MKKVRLAIILTSKSKDDGSRRAFVAYSENALEVLDSVKSFDPLCESWEADRFKTLKDVERFFSKNMGFTAEPIVCDDQRVIGAYAIV